MQKSLVGSILLNLLWFVVPGAAGPVTAHHTQGFLHGFLVVKDMDDKIEASGELNQNPSGARVTAVMTLHFRDGSLYQETAVFTQRQVYRLLNYKRVMKGPSFKDPQTLSLDATTGKVSVNYTDKGKEKVDVVQLSLPPDLANGILTMLLANLDSPEATFSLLVATPKPRVVKLKISSDGEDRFSVGGAAAKANRFVIRADLGLVTGAVAKVIGKEPPPAHVWMTPGSAAAFLKSEGPLYEDGPIWRIELAAPMWPSAAKTPPLSFMR